MAIKKWVITDQNDVILTKKLDYFEAQKFLEKLEVNAKAARSDKKYRLVNTEAAK